MKISQLARRGRWHYRRSHMAVGAGVAVATAVLVGALIVGDSVRGSLRGLTLERLGQIDQVIVPGRPFRAALAEELTIKAAPLGIVPATLTRHENGQKHRANRVTLLGVDDRFWQMGKGNPGVLSDGLALTPALAADLGAKIGDEVLLRVPRPGSLPADSVLGERIETTVSRRYKVTAILSEKGLARFSLTPSQQSPRNAFLPLDALQKLLGQQGMCHVLALSSQKNNQPIEVRPQLVDYGLSLETLTIGSDRFLQLESEALVLPQVVVTAAEQAWGQQNLQPVVTYLANTIRVKDRSIPYSTVAGVEGLPGVGTLADDQVVLNRWAAEDLGSEVGDRVTLTYYEPESTHGVLREAGPVTLRLVGIIDLQQKNQPTAAADPRLTPRLEGVSDAQSIGDWDLPFDLVEKIRPQDEAYWESHSTTPKAFVSPSLARRLWRTRWGEVSLMRFLGTVEPKEAESMLLSAIDPASLGFGLVPLRAQGLAASAGSTPFDVLFLLFSLFLIAAAAMLIALLIKLTIEGRSSEIGLLGAIGLDQRWVRSLLMRELMPVAAVGAGLGLVLGVAYAGLLLWGLRTIWIDAIGTPFLALHGTPVSLVGGWFGGIGIAWLVVRRVVAVATATPPKRLLSCGKDLKGPRSVRPTIRKAWMATGLFAGAMLLGVLGKSLRGEVAAGAFFGSGSLTLAASLMGLAAWLGRRPKMGGGLSLAGLAWSNVVRGGGRSLLTIGLVAAASFMILATSAFRLPPTELGTAGYQLIAESDQPIFQDPNSADGQLELGFSAADEQQLATWRIDTLRVAEGEDASCRNLYQTTRPRLLGAPHNFLTRNGFVWAEQASKTDENPWLALERPIASGALPVVLDFNTAVYALKLYGGVGSQLMIEDQSGNPLTLEVVGLLKNSLLQGVLILGEANLVEHFPSTVGYQLFLIAPREGAAPASDGGESAELGLMLEDRLSDFGFDAEQATDRLANFLAVQNTYLSTFQALGGLGLLLGAVGLAVAQLHNLAQRRGELALMRASGFRLARLRYLVLLETLLQLGGGLLLGALAAGVALLPLEAASGASLPWLETVCLLLVTLMIGLVASRLAAGQALSAPITPALRGE